jgi:transcriptional regulator with XRE-family HTH domain
VLPYTGGMQSVSTRIRRAREKQGISRFALAQRAGVSPYTVRRVEEGHTAQLDTIEALCGALGLRLSITQETT